MQFTRAVITILVSFITMQVLVSCSAFKKPTRRQYTKVKKYPRDQPFVYYNEIKVVNDKLSKEEKAVLSDGLRTQLDDSMHTVVKESYVFFKKLQSPAVYDTTYAISSARNMEIFLKTEGYYNGKVNYELLPYDTIHKDNPEKKQIRVATKFIVNTGPVFRIDSVALIPNDSGHTYLVPLQELSNLHRSESLLKKGKPFSEQLISAEMNRLVELYRNNGYYNFTRDAIYTDVDTVFLALLDPLLALDPFRQIEVFQEAQERQKNPLINVYIRTKPNLKKSVFQLFTNHKIVVYPEYKGGEKTDSIKYKEDTDHHTIVRYREGTFKPLFIRRNLALSTDSLFSALNVNKTVEELNKLNVWQVIRIQPKISLEDSSKIDYDLLLIPYKRYTFSTNLEGVFNQPLNQLTGAGNLVGLGVNFGLQDRNIAKQGIQMTNSLRTGIEFGLPPINAGLQSTELTFSNSITWPRIPDKLFAAKNRGWFNRKTFLTSNISIIDRNINKNGAFALTTISSTFGWQFQTAKNALFRVSPLNVEYVNLYDISSNFREQLNNNPFLRTSFNQGLVMGIVNIGYKQPFQIKKHKNHAAALRINFEESGALFGRFKKSIKLFDKELFEYVKADAEFRYSITNEARKREWVFHGAAGAGFLYDNNLSNMPFFKQFAGGGPNSMRAWPLRSLGPGASRNDPRTGRNQFFSRSGDMMIEGNVEYRYNIWSIWPNTLILRGALFTDIGNVWNFRNQSNIGNDTVVFQLKNFYRDLSVSVGTGFRLDFVGLFLIRVDVGYRLKNPAYPFVLSNDGWRIPNLSDAANLFKGSDAARNWRYDNMNISLGIGLPFQF